MVNDNKVTGWQRKTPLVFMLDVHPRSDAVPLACRHDEVNNPENEDGDIVRLAVALEEIAAHLRAELRGQIRHYRLWRTARDVCELRTLYRDAEGAALRRHLGALRALYREACADLAAARRRVAGKR